MADLMRLEDVDRDLGLMRPQLAEIMPPGTGIPVERIIRTIMVSVERQPKLLQCTRQSIINGAWTFAVLGLEVDGITGQGYLIPYKVRGALVAQAQIGFKGHSTIAARSGFILDGNVIREGDHYDVQLGTGGYVKVRPKFGGRDKRAIIAAYATLQSKSFPSIVDVIDLDEILKIRAMSRSTDDDSPWARWFDQMAIKSAKKRLGKSSPLNLLHAASAIDDQGGHAFIGQDGLVRIEHEAAPLAIEQQAGEAVTLQDKRAKVFMADGSERVFADVASWRAWTIMQINKATDPAQIAGWRMRNGAEMMRLSAIWPDDAVLVSETITRRMETLSKKGKADGTVQD